MKRKIRALVFEDEPTIRILFETVLKIRGGYEVVSFADPSDSKLSDFNPCSCENKLCADIVISDIKMPSMNGLDFLEQHFAQACQLNLTNVAIMSGLFTDECEERAEKLNAFIMRKPFTINVIEEFLDKCEENIDFDKELIDIADLIKE
jgi:CheY-like chemotaxis protein